MKLGARASSVRVGCSGNVIGHTTCHVTGLVAFILLIFLVWNALLL